MTKKIFEELPARKHAPAAAPAAAAKSGGDKEKGAGAEGSEKRIRQAVYDIRYRARREGVDLRAAYAQYMQNSNLSAPEQAAVRAKLFGKDGGGDKKESYDALMTDSATDVVANAMFKVFVEKHQPVEQVIEEITKDRKYKVRVTDPKNDRSYVRYATREKITQLRSRGLKVEMTEHGEPYEGRKKEVPNNKSGLDKPVHPSQRDGDVNDDGKKDKTDSYIYNRRDAINAAIARKKGMKEEFLADATTSTEGQNKGKITGNNVDNYSTGIIKINPENEADQGNRMGRMRGIYAHTELEGELISEKAKSKAQQRFMAMVYSRKKGKMKKGEASPEVEAAAASMTTKEAKKFAKTKHKGLPEKKEMKEEMEGTCPKCGKCPCECENKDNRAAKTYRELLKNKIRSMGIKNPIMLGDYDEKVMKVMTKNDDATRMMVSGGTLGGPMMGSMKAESCGKDHSAKKKNKKVIEGREMDEPDERDDNPDVIAHNRSLRNKKGKRAYPSGRVGYGRRPDISKDPRYGSVD